MGGTGAIRKKTRVNHIHHCIDAITIACITKENYENLARFYHKYEELKIKGVEQLPQVEKPWPTFTEDVKQGENEVLVSHYTPDVLPKQTQKVLRVRGKIKKEKNGKPIYQKGDTVRGSLHQQTFYGAIKNTVVNKKGESEEVTKYVVRKSLDSLEDSSIKNIVDDRVKSIIENARKEEKKINKLIDAQKRKLANAEEEEVGEILTEIEKLKQQISDLYTLPNKNGDPVPIRKVRIYQTSVTNPLHIKQQRDKSKKKTKPHKEFYHVANDSNYAMAIYEGKDNKGNIKRDFELLNNLEAGQFFKYSVQKDLKPQGLNHLHNLVPNKKAQKKTEMPLKAFLKIGTMVILFEKTPDEVWDLTKAELNRRLYKVVGLSNQRIVRPSGKIDEYATIVMRFHLEASQSSDLKTMDGKFEKNEVYKAQRKMNHNQFNALIEGIDFKISPLGKIKKI